MNKLTQYIKTPEQIEKMRVAGRLAAKVLEMIAPYVIKNVTTEELDQLCHNYIVNELNAIPACLGYRGFPKSICTSINHVVCHGIPKDKKLKNGDIVNIDVTVIKDGYHGDTSQMFMVGNVLPVHQKLCTVAQQALYKGIKMVKPGISLRAIGREIEQFAKSHHMSSVRDFCGHGIGSEFHENHFQVLHYDDPNAEHDILLPGLTFTIEPMINLGKHHVRILSDNWTAVTKDKSYSAQYEHTLLVTKTGVEILTLRANEEINL
ncbi:MAG: type I methionyl aminopeptidase [Gammaproteobacteria bacterium]|jgi:methionyl aminopeptidase|nr:type I methionyl aminopeptidase [Gammaproteobacteria bacterium]